jgi:glycine oxidase
LANVWGAKAMGDVLVVGGGVVGLSLAYALAQRGVQTEVVDRAEAGRGASWAAAGILPPPSTALDDDPLEQLRVRSHALHFQWARQLQDETGVDSQLRRSGGIYLARQATESALLAVRAEQLVREGVQVERLSTAELLEHEPALASIAPEIRDAYRLPDECRIRTPRHLRALLEACRRRGVSLCQHAGSVEITASSGRIQGLRTRLGIHQADHYVFAVGAWAQGLLAPLGVVVPVEPRRGQIIMWQLSQPIVTHVVNEGLRYVVPRDDGTLLAGATVEEVGFDTSTTPQATEQLREFACRLLPQLRDQPVQRAWAGLRPWTPDGLPYLGLLPGLDNAWAALGHFRSGIHLAPASAELLADVITGRTPAERLAPFRVDR